jgi:hypothetical protein
MAGEHETKLLDWDALEVGQPLPGFSYVLTQQMIDEFRQGVMDPEAAFPTISHKVDVNAYHAAYHDDGSVNARCTFHCYNPPVAGKKITVQAWIADKYYRRGKNYIVTETGPSQFTDEATAQGVLGTKGTVASGRMSLTFGTELLRRFFGPDIYNRNGAVELRFLRPVRPGDTVTFAGKVTDIAKVTNGVRVGVEVSATNQKGDTTAAGTGSCIVPSLWVPSVE